MRIMDWLKGIFSKLRGGEWDPSEIEGLGTWDTTFRAEGGSAASRVTRRRSRSGNGLPLAARLADVDREVEELQRTLPNLRDV